MCVHSFPARSVRDEVFVRFLDVIYQQGMYIYLGGKHGFSVFFNSSLQYRTSYRYILPCCAEGKASSFTTFTLKAINLPDNPCKVR